ncbi:MAG: helix-turn-helix domain-containing protein [Gammaproteobacteria bacterium]|nr:helix-turn-helix domain-containing protein [Gammaproteobacteria bacterium]
MLKTVTANPVTSEFNACRRCRAARLCRLARKPPAGTDASTKVVLRHRRLRRGDYLYRTGDPLHSLGVVCSGSVQTCLLHPDGTTQITGFHLAGEFTALGDMNAKQHTRDGVALETTCVCEILLSQLLELCHESPDVRRDVLQLVFDQLAHNEAQLLPLVGRKSATEQLAAFLLSLSERLAERGFSGEDFSLSMSRQDIGSYLGLAKETISRLFSRLENEGVISLDARRLRLTDPRRLAGLAAGATGL